MRNKTTANAGEVFYGYFCVDRFGMIGLVSECEIDSTRVVFSIGHNVDRLRKKSSIIRMATLEEIQMAGFEGVGCKNAEDAHAYLERNRA